MTWNHSRALPPALCLALALFLAPELHAAPDEAPTAGDSEAKDWPDAGKVLSGALKALRKEKGYDVTLSVDGGIADSGDHQIDELAVRETYSAKVFRTQYMHVPDMKTFRRYPDKGTRFSDGVWRHIQSDEKGNVMNRLFKFPAEALADAAKHAKVAAWVPTSVPTAKDLETEANERELDAELEDLDRELAKLSGEEPKTKGRTVVARPDAKKAEAIARLPRTLRVEAPPEVALTHFLKVENSGCLSGG